MFRLTAWAIIFCLMYASYELTSSVTKMPHANFAAAPAPVASNSEPNTAQPARENVVSSQPKFEIPMVKSFKETCETALGASEVSVVTADQAVEFDYSKRVYELTQLANNATSLTLGLTVSQPKVNFVWDMRMLQDPVTRKVCMKPKITLSLVLAEHKVYIGKEFRQGSCAFNEIMAHELKHANTNIDSVKKIAKFMEQYIKASVENRVIYGESREQLEKYIVEAIQDHWLPMVNLEFSRVLASHKEIDSPEEYARVNNSCSGEIPEVLNRFNLRG